MKLGLVARADNTGLGIQTWEFYRHMKPAKVMLIDISELNGNPQHYERYANAQIVQGFPNRGDIREFLTGLDCIFVAESPYNYALYDMAKEMGVKVAVQYNYEFFDWYSFPYFPTPDLLIAPSRWHFDQVDEWAKARGIAHIYIHVPVNRNVIPKRRITKATTFIHIQGKEAAHDRNGTEIVRRAAEIVGDRADIQILTQANGAGRLHYWELYETGDVLLLPRRYGGNCLPLNEALSAGMPVIMPDVSPNNQLLPREWLLPATKVGEFKPRMVVDIYGVEPEDLATKILEFAAMDIDEMETQNLLADAIAKSISWDALGRVYAMALGELCRQT